MTRVDALYLLSRGHLLRILIPLEEPPHLTAGLLIVRVYFIRKMLKNSQLQAHPPALPGVLEYALLSKGKKQIAVRNSQNLIVVSAAHADSR